MVILAIISFLRCHILLTHFVPGPTQIAHLIVCSSQECFSEIWTYICQNIKLYCNIMAHLVFSGSNYPSFIFLLMFCPTWWVEELYSYCLWEPMMITEQHHLEDYAGGRILHPNRKWHSVTSTYYSRSGPL